MRRSLSAGLLGLAAALALAVPAGAITTAHFSVRAINTSSHRTHNGFRFTERLRRHGRTVGHDKVRCHTGRRKISCDAVFYFPAGKVKAEGKFGSGDNRLQVTGGTRRYDGVAGKVLIHNRGPHNTRLEFVLVK